MWDKVKWIYIIVLLKLTDGVDDAAISVASAVQGGQVSDSLLSQFVLREYSNSFSYITFYRQTFTGTAIDAPREQNLSVFSVWSWKTIKEIIKGKDFDFLPAQLRPWLESWCSRRGTGASGSRNGWRQRPWCYCGTSQSPQWTWPQTQN